MGTLRVMLGYLGLVMLLSAILMLIMPPPAAMTTLTVGPEGVTITTDNPLLELMLVIGGLALVYIGFCRRKD